MYKIKYGLIRVLIAVLLVCTILGGCTPKSTSTVSSHAVSSYNGSLFASIKEENILQENMMKTIEELASEKYRGRLPGSKGNQLAAQYLASQFEEMGLKNPERLDNYMQYFIQPTVQLKDKPVLQVIDKNGKVLADFNYPEDFVIRRLSSKTDTIDIEVPLYYTEEYSMLGKESTETEEKAVLVPWKFYGLFGSQNRPDDLAKRCGASLAISEFDLSKNDLGYKQLKVTPLAGPWIYNIDYSPFIYVNSGTFAQLSEAAKAGCKVRFSCNTVLDHGTKAANVVGLIPGSDPVLKDSYIIIGAHFDHVGDNMDGTYNPGALDNASGVAAMLEIARVINENKIKPKQSILFIAFNGEESGLNGSIYYVENSLYPLYKSVMINLDMVGAASGEPLSIAMNEIAYTTDKKKSVRDAFAKYADKLGLDYKTIFESGSDHTPFSYFDVPSVCLVDLDLGLGYHSPEDTAKVIDGERLRDITRLVLYYLDKNAY